MFTVGAQAERYGEDGFGVRVTVRVTLRVAVWEGIVLGFTFWLGLG